MTEKIMNVLNAHTIRCGNVVCEASGMICPSSFPYVTEEIAQMFCDNIMREMCNTGQIQNHQPDEWDMGALINMGFTEQQIINSLEKLKKENVRS